MNSISSLLSQIPSASKKRFGLGIALASILLGFWFSNASAPEPERADVIVQEVLAPSKFLVHVAGAVNEPGIYELNSGDRVSDAIELAGGFNPTALESSVNLARMVADGEQILVLDLSQVEQGSGFISLNSSSAEKLEQLPGIGPATAKKIVDHRTKIGSFSSIEEIVDVPGIGPSLLEKIRSQLTL